MNRVMIVGVMLLAGTLAASAREDKNPPPAGKAADKQTPAAKEWDRLMKDFNTSLTEIRKSHKNAKTEAERNQVLDRAQASVQLFGQRFLDLAQKYPKDPIAFDALVWVVTTRIRPTATPEADKALGVLARDYARDNRVASICRGVADSASPNAEQFLRQVLDKNPKESVQGEACYALGQYFKNRSEREAAKKETAATATASRKQAETYYQRVIDKYGKVKSGAESLGEEAKTGLYEIRHLAIGLPAPDIEGEDSGGKKFKLSDYRGKVVLLDFWARW